MPDVNFGLLNTTPIQPQTQVIQVPNRGLQEAQGVLSGATTGADIASKMQENARANALLPSQLQNNQAIAQKATIDAQNAKQEQTLRSADLIAYQKGGIDGYQKSLESHDPQAAMTLADARENHQNLIATHATAQMQESANMWHVIQSSPNPMQAYQQMKPSLMRVDPNLPNIQTKSQLDAYAMGAMSTAVGYTQQQKSQLSYGMEVAKINAQGSSNIAQDSIKNAGQDAEKAKDTLSSVDAYNSTLKQITDWNTQHPDQAVPVGPGFTGWKAAKQALAAVGGPTDALDKMEQLQGASGALFKDTLASLKTMPRSAAIIEPFQKAMANPSDTVGAQKARMQMIEYGAQQKIGYADFLQQYNDANGTISGAQGQWAKFVQNDPALKDGKLPDPSYLTPDNYLNYTNRNYTPAQTNSTGSKTLPVAPAQKTAASSFQEGKIYQDAKGNKATFTNGKWTPVQ